MLQKVNNMAARKSRFANFVNDFEKIELIKAVERRPVLWDLTSKLHFNIIVIKCAWDEIGAELGKSSNDCKTAWAGLRDKYRQNLKQRAKRSKSGSAGGCALSGPLIGDWELTPYMSFLNDMSELRTSMASSCSGAESCNNDIVMEPVLFEVGVDVDLDGDVDLNASTSSATQQPQYSYQQKRGKKRKNSDDDQLLHNIMVSHQNLLDNISKPTPVEPLEPLEPHFVFWRSILSKMDKEASEKAVAKLTNILLQEHQEYKDANK